MAASPYLPNNTSSFLPKTYKPKTIGSPNLKDQFTNLTYQMYPRGVSQVGFGNQLENERQGSILEALKALQGVFQNAQGLESQKNTAIQRALTYLSPGNQMANVDRFGRAATSTATENARQNDALLKSLGYGEGYTSGSARAASDDATRQTNAYRAQVMSPEYQQQVLGSLLGTISQGQNSQLANSISPILSLILQGQQSPVLQDTIQAYLGEKGVAQPKGQDPLFGLLGALAGGGAFNGLIKGIGGLFK